MKPVAIILSLGMLVEAAPHPQFSLPFSLPTGIDLGDLSLPTSLAGLDSLGDLASELSDIIKKSPADLPSGIPASPTPTAFVTPTSLPTSIALPSAFSSARPTLVPRQSSDLTSRDILSDTENDVTSNTGCKALTVIFARGTLEPGNVGLLAGPPMFSALNDSTGGQVAVQGVDYAASIAGNANLGSDGGPVMADLAAQAISQCPDTKIVLSGYSQGAMVVHNAATSLESNGTSIAAAVLFGDPFNGESVGSIANVKEFCADGDELCHGLILITPAHLTYSSDASEAASFIVNATGVTG